MFNEHSISKVSLGVSFLLRQGQGFLLEIDIFPLTLLANTPRKVKHVKMAQVSQFLNNPIHARLFLQFKSPGGGL